MMQLTNLASHLSPLCYLPSGSLVCYRLGNIILLNDGIVEKEFPIFYSKRERIFGKYRYLYRLLRMGIRAAEAIDEQYIVLSIDNMLYELDLASCKLSTGYFCGDGIRPLIFTTVKGISSVDEGIYFGGYLGNRDKRPVSIYKRVNTDQWQTVFTFPQGAINHVHTIVSDHYRDCLWIFTGDFDKASAIWKVTDNFEKVERIVCNEQKYRGCVAFILPEGLLYATDSPFADNFIYLMNIETLQVKEIVPIDGSCIYGCRWQNKFVFSSTVEGDGRNTSIWEFLFGRKRGSGIKDMYVHLYVGNLQEGFKEVYKQKKDCMPFYTFQFGVFKFPYGVNYNHTLYFQPVATYKNDLALMALNIRS